MATFTILEPMSTGDVIDRSVRLYRRNFAPLVTIVAIPTLVGYVSSLTFWYGYTSLLSSATGARGIRVDAVAMLALGSIGYPIYMFLLLATVAGLSRAIGDHLMMGEPITFRNSLSAVRKKAGNILLLGLLLVALLIGLYVVFSMIVIGLVLVASLVAGIMAAAQLPQWVTVALVIVLALIFLAALIFLFCQIVARVVFLPQVVMIEGESAGTALGRAVRLGKGNWHRVGAILLFTYFVSLSLLSALTLPVLAGVYLAGYSTTEFYLSSGWTIVYSSFRDIASLLSFPVWIVSFTLLYFDSRVRKEAYDLELLAREVAPGFYWQPVRQTPSGYAPPMFSEGSTAPAGADPSAQNDKFSGSVEWCAQCGNKLQAGARFCMNCGGAAGSSPANLEQSL